MVTPNQLVVAFVLLVIAAPAMSIVIESPASIAGTYPSRYCYWHTMSPTVAFSGELVKAEPWTACGVGPLLNADALKDKIAWVIDGKPEEGNKFDCNKHHKIQRAMNSGAKAAIITASREEGWVTPPRADYGPADNIVIFSVTLDWNTSKLLEATYANGSQITVRFEPDETYREEFEMQRKYWFDFILAFEILFWFSTAVCLFVMIKLYRQNKTMRSLPFFIVANCMAFCLCDAIHSIDYWDGRGWTGEDFIDTIYYSGSILEVQLYTMLLIFWCATDCKLAPLWVQFITAMSSCLRVQVNSMSGMKGAMSQWMSRRATIGLTVWTVMVYAIGIFFLVVQATGDGDFAGAVLESMTTVFFAVLLALAMIFAFFGAKVVRSLYLMGKQIGFNKLQQGRQFLLIKVSFFIIIFTVASIIQVVNFMTDTVAPPNPPNGPGSSLHRVYWGMIPRHALEFVIQCVVAVCFYPRRASQKSQSTAGTAGTGSASGRSGPSDSEVSADSSSVSASASVAV